MKNCIKIFAVLAVLFVIFLAVIKFVQKCSWKDSMGIIEELWKEAKANCFICKMKKQADEDVPEEVEV